MIKAKKKYHSCRRPPRPAPPAARERAPTLPSRHQQFPRTCRVALNFGLGRRMGDREPADLAIAVPERHGRRILAPPPGPDQGLHQPQNCYPIFSENGLMNSFVAHRPPSVRSRDKVLKTVVTIVAVLMCLPGCCSRKLHTALSCYGPDLRLRADMKRAFGDDVNVGTVQHSIRLEGCRTYCPK